MYTIFYVEKYRDSSLEVTRTSSCDFYHQLMWSCFHEYNLCTITRGGRGAMRVPIYLNLKKERKCNKPKQMFFPESREDFFFQRNITISLYGQCSRTKTPALGIMKSTFLAYWSYILSLPTLWLGIEEIFWSLCIFTIWPVWPRTTCRLRTPAPCLGSWCLQFWNNLSYPTYIVWQYSFWLH